LEPTLKNEHIFCHQVLDAFSKYALNTSELKIRQEKVPSPKCNKKVKACWKKTIENLHPIVKSSKQVISEKENLFASLLQMDLAGTTNEVQYPNLILKSFSVTKEAFQEQVDILKGLSFKKFYGILEHHLDEHERWVLDYASHNE
jgi:trehalose/maltose hydrolase-like predicted phosphorylase